MKRYLRILAAALFLTAGVVGAQTTIIGEGGGVGIPSSGNGNFETNSGPVPGANTTWPISQMPDWHNLSGDETQTCGTDQGTTGSPEASSYGAYLFPSFVVANDTGYAIGAAREMFDVSLYVNKFGAAGNYNGDEAVVATLFTSSTGVDDNTVLADITTLATATFPVNGSWFFNSANAFTPQCRRMLAKPSILD